MYPLSSSWVIMSTNSRTANSVEFFFLKPYWLELKLGTIGHLDGSGHITGRR